MSSQWAVRLGVVVSWSFLGLVVAEEKAAIAPEQEFTVMAYNVENIFDVDRVTPYDDYLESLRFSSGCPSP